MGRPMRELHDWHGDHGRHARNAAADAHSKHAPDSPKHAAQDALKLKMLTDPVARVAEHLRHRKAVEAYEAKHAMGQLKPQEEKPEQAPPETRDRPASKLAEKWDSPESQREGLVTVPVYATANLLLGFRPRDKHWWEYLDQIWDSAETAERTSLTVLPALMLRARKESTSQDTRGS